MSRKNRLDLHMFQKGLVSSRQKAQQLIRAGKVRESNGQLLDKPGQEVRDDIELLIKESPRFVSRGGQKLLGAIEAFKVQVQGRVCLDAGISTGGFTDCLLQYGAERVYGIDVGYGQTAWKIRTDPRVVLRERTNLRTLNPDDLFSFEDPFPSLAVADLSFISLKLVLAPLKDLLEPLSPEAILLVKPQFEVGRERVGKGGVVRNPDAHLAALKGVLASAKDLGWFPQGIIESPITGPAGNHEYLLWLGIDKFKDFPDIEDLVSKTLL
ncbi:TlyA family RNA methyltransferase [Prochlorococcus sp. MIT 1341]|uniref:TlyA family RNA methyltransferase n=1 Tax=Prochlorococcus sp. MIT 1341 TaxID=3096221 RepID=UPI002A75339A|nr:TlyA family RNA methyltransferase [Prochlorococcus sp. MIT 1341]